MLKKIDNAKKNSNCCLSMLYPGLSLKEGDSGFYSIGRIDHAQMGAGTVIDMHSHVNDDILFYFRSGKMQHADSKGFSKLVTSYRPMLLKAGKLFYHREVVLEDLEGLQIFIRPREKDSIPEVIFHELDAVYSINEWRLIASPEKDKTVLQLSSQTWIYDLQISKGSSFGLPMEPVSTLAFLLYVFQGEVIATNDITLKEGESLFIQDEVVRFWTDNNASLVLFVTDTTSTFYDKGMYSGNLFTTCR